MKLPIEYDDMKVGDIIENYDYDILRLKILFKFCFDRAVVEVLSGGVSEERKEDVYSLSYRDWYLVERKNYSDLDKMTDEELDDYFKYRKDNR